MGRLADVLAAATSFGPVERHANEPCLVSLTAAGLSAAP
jgi:hypothetical protein